MALLGAYKIPIKKKTVESAVKIKSGWLKISKKSKKSEKYEYLYEGQLEEGRANGYGVLTRIYGDGTMWKEYAGGWVDGKKQGPGALWFLDGGFYKGEFCQGKRHGFGRLWLCDGSFYQGTWNTGSYHGTGMLLQGKFLSHKITKNYPLNCHFFLQVNGNRYEGKFSRGKKEGTGIFYHFLTGQIQEGIWSNGVCKNSIIVDMNYRGTARHPIPELVSQ